MNYKVKLKKSSGQFKTIQVSAENEEQARQRALYFEQEDTTIEKLVKEQ